MKTGLLKCSPDLFLIESLVPAEPLTSTFSRNEEWCFRCPPWLAFVVFNFPFFQPIYIYTLVVYEFRFVLPHGFITELR